MIGRQGEEKIFLILIIAGVIFFFAGSMISNIFSCKAENTDENPTARPAAFVEVEETEEVVYVKEPPPPEKKETAKEYDFSDLSSWNLTISAWENLSEKNYKGVFTYTKKCLDLYEKEALLEAEGMRNFARLGHEDEKAVVNDVATCLYIMGEAYMREEKFGKAIEEFEIVTEKYPYAQCWDPKGWFWKVAEVSKKNIEKIKKLTEKK